MNLRTIPIFPLSLVAYPGENLNLHIFEERYRQLVHDLNETGGTFAIPPYQEDKLKPIATELRLESIDQIYEDGRMDIKTKGVGILKIEKVINPMPGKLYAGAEVLKIDQDYHSDLALSKIILSKLEELFDIMKIEFELAPLEKFKVYNIAQKAGMSFEQEIELLKLNSEVARQQFLINHLETILPVLKEVEIMKKRIQMNGHFKNIIPPNI